MITNIQLKLPHFEVLVSITVQDFLIFNFKNQAQKLFRIMHQQIRNRSTVPSIYH